MHNSTIYFRAYQSPKTPAAKTKNGPEAHTIHYILSGADYSAREPFSQAVKNRLH